MKTTEKLTLTDVQQQFEHWRTTRQHRSPIPQELWDAAISLVGKHSTLEISKVLNLTHSKLKKRIDVSLSSQPTTPSTDFVKVGVIQPPAAPPSCVLEVSDKNGAAMTVSMTGTPCLDVVELVKAFLSRTP
jgi:hypothetical protein